jgi:hypothetical protein
MDLKDLLLSRYHLFLPLRILMSIGASGATIERDLATVLPLLW